MTVLNARTMFVRCVYPLIFVLVVLDFSGCGKVKAVMNRPVEYPVIQDENVEKQIADLDSFDAKDRMRGAESLGNITMVREKFMGRCSDALLNSAGTEARKIMDDMAVLSDNAANSIDHLCNSSRDFDAKVRAASASSLSAIAMELGKSLKALEQVIADTGKDDDQTIAQAARKTRDVIQKKIDKITDTLVQNSNDSNGKVKTIVADSLRSIRSMKNASILVESRKKDKDPEPVAEVPPVKKDEPEKTVKKEESEKRNDKDHSHEPDVAVAPSPEIPKSEDIKNSPMSFPELKKLIEKLDSFDIGTRRFALTALTPFISKEMVALPDQIASVKSGDIAIRIKSANDINELTLKMEKLVYVLCHTMEDMDSDIRSSAAKNVGDILGPISAALRNLDESPREIEDAMKKQKVKADPTVQMQIDQFKSVSYDTVEKIITILHKGMHVLFKAIDDKSYLVRVSAGKSLRKIVVNSEEVSPIIPVWERAMKPLGMTAKEVTIRLMMNELGNDSVDVARKAARDIAELGPDARSAVPALIKAVTNKSNLHVHYKYVKIEAMEALGNIGPDAMKAVPALILQLDDVNYEIRASAVKALGKISSRDAVVRMVDILDNDSSSMVKEAATLALGNMDPTDWLDKVYISLFNALKDMSGQIRLNAFKTLAIYEAKNNGEGIVKWKSIDKTVLGYKVCYISPSGKEDDYCVDTGLVSAIRLSDLKKHGKGIENIKVQAYQKSGTRDIEIKFIDIKALLQKSMEVETEKGLRTQKEKAMLQMIETILKNKVKSASISGEGK